MSYIGSTPTTQSFIAGTDSFNGTGSQTNFTLSRFVNSTNDIQVVVNNVVQYPPNYSVSGNTLTISPAPSAGTNNVYVRYLSTTLQSITVPGGSTVVGNFGLSGNLQLLGSAQRITGDFSNSTLANRAAFQTSTVNGATTVNVIPNGTSQISSLVLNSTSTVTDASTAQLVVTDAESSFRAGRNGTGTYLPMTFYTGGSERVRVDTSGRVTMPYQPFYVGVDRSSSLNTGGEATFVDWVHSITLINTGSNMNTSTGVFTCPIAGRYFVQFNVLARATGAHNVEIRKNNAIWVRARDIINSSGNENCTGLSTVVDCAASDNIRISVSNGASADFYLQWNSTTIYLVG
jgi:hypothetical protein